MGAPHFLNFTALLQRLNTWTKTQIFPQGSSSAPSITFDGVTNSGLSCTAGGNLSFSTGGAQRTRITGANLLTGGLSAPPVLGYATAGSIATPSAAGVYSKNTAKFWVSFDGTGTPAIRDSWNVASITDYGVNNWGLIFVNDMGTSNYAFAGSAYNSTSSYGPTTLGLYNATSKTSSQLRIAGVAHGAASNSMGYDCEHVDVVGFAQ